MTFLIHMLPNVDVAVVGDADGNAVGDVVVVADADDAVADDSYQCRRSLLIRCS